MKETVNMARVLYYVSLVSTNFGQDSIRPSAVPNKWTLT